MFQSQVQDTEPQVLEKENDDLEDFKMFLRLKFSHDKSSHQQSSDSHEEQGPKVCMGSSSSGGKSNHGSSKFQITSYTCTKRYVTTHPLQTDNSGAFNIRSGGLSSMGLS